MFNKKSKEQNCKSKLKFEKESNNFKTNELSAQSKKHNRSTLSWNCHHISNSHQGPWECNLLMLTLQKLKKSSHSIKYSNKKSNKCNPKKHQQKISSKSTKKYCLLENNKSNKINMISTSSGLKFKNKGSPYLSDNSN